MSAVDPETLYAALLSDGDRLRTLRRLQYRGQGCRCLLLDAIEVPEPERVLLHQLRYKHGPERNSERSSAEGRAANTYDGDNHWKPRTFYIGTSALDLTDAEGATLNVLCDHVDVNMKPSEFRADWSAGHADVTVRPDGSRYAR